MLTDSYQTFHVRNKTKQKKKKKRKERKKKNKKGGTHYAKSILICLLVRGPYFSLFRLNKEICSINLFIDLEYEKIRTRKYP